MPTESKKLQTEFDSQQRLVARDDAALHDARIAHELMDPARWTPETPLEREQREVILRMEECLKVCKQRLSDLGFPETHYIDDVRADARATIAKAEGSANV